MPMERGPHAKTPSSRSGFREFRYDFGRNLPYAHASFTIPELEDGFDFRDFARTVCMAGPCTWQSGDVKRNLKFQTPLDRP
jgi:hypothetical protein